jgi:hypothetical protein
MRRARKDSVTAGVQTLQNAEQEIPLPLGVELRSEEERVIWLHFTRARAKADWRDFDLLLLAKAVRLEADIRKHQNMLDTSGPLIKNKRETLVENPLIRVIDTLQRQQLALIRSMSLTQQGTDPRTMNAAGKEEQESADILRKLGVDSLLAMPTRQ